MYRTVDDWTLVDAVDASLQFVADDDDSVVVADCVYCNNSSLQLVSWKWLDCKWEVLVEIVVGKSYLVYD